MIDQIYAFSAGLSSSILPTGCGSEDEIVQHFSYYWSITEDFFFFFTYLFLTFRPLYFDQFNVSFKRKKYFKYIFEQKCE